MIPGHILSGKLYPMTKNDYFLCPSVLHPIQPFCTIIFLTHKTALHILNPHKRKFLSIRYFNYLAKDTVSDGAKLKVQYAPVTIKCNGCQEMHTVNLRERMKYQRACPKCGVSRGMLVAGQEYYIKDIE